MIINEKEIIGIAAILSIIVSIIALENYRKTAGTQGASALRNSFDGQFTDNAEAFNPNDQTNLNGMSAYNRRTDLEQPNVIYVGKFRAGQTIPLAGVGGPSGGRPSA